MNLKQKLILILFISLLVPLGSSAQLLKRLNKGTSKREIRKRQDEADEKSSYNKFNKLQPMGKKTTKQRNDYLWSEGTANVVPHKGGDIAVVESSRYSPAKGSEIGASLGSMYWVPNLYYKKLWRSDTYYVASKHQLLSYAPMLHYASDRGSELLNNYDTIPNVLSLRNELIVSRPFLKQLSCGGAKQPYLVITLGLGVSFGYRFNNANVDSLVIKNKFLESRGGLVLGNNGYASIRLQGDYLITTSLYATLALRGLLSDHKYSNAFETNASVQYHFAPKFSVSGGMFMHYSSRKGFAILPLVDLKYHFGMRDSREEGLFSKKGYRTLKKK